MTRPGTKPFLIAALGLLLTGCPGQYAQQKLQNDVDGLKRELAAIRAETKKGESDLALRTRLADLGAALEQLRTDISLLQGRMESFQDSFSKRNDEQLKVRQDLEIRIAQLDEQVRAIQMQIEALSKSGTTGALPMPTPVAGASPAPTRPVPDAPPTPHAVTPEQRDKILAIKNGTTTPAPTPAGKETDQQIYQRGAEALDGKRYADARVIWGELLTKFPKSEYADNARYWMGESYYAEKDYASAILEFDKVVRDYPGGDKVPAALLKQGLAFLEIGEKEGGVATLQDLVKKYPKSEEAKKAKDRLQKLR